MFEVEELADKFEVRRSHRVHVTMDVRKRFLHHFSKIASDAENNDIPLSEIKKFRDAVALEKDGNRFLTSLGFRDKKKTLLAVLDKAINVSDEQKALKFHYKDFNFYYTILEPSIPILRSKLATSLLAILLFYVMTPIVFCSLDIRGICPVSGTDGKHDYHGIMSAVYFASTTMSTVGYGDLSVFGNDYEPNEWEILLGTVYMVIAAGVSVTALSAGFNMTSNLFEVASKYVLDILTGLSGGVEQEKDELLYMRIRRVKRVKLFGISLQFILLNLIGMFVSRFFVSDKVVNEGEETDGWTWMMSLYWAVQTTLTVGYGDLTMDDNMRLFNIFFLVFSTIFVGDALGKLADLNKEIQQIRRNWAFERREVSKGMIDEFQAYENDGKIDQYEFLVASLLALNKISSKDITPIMDKFRKLAGEDGMIGDDDIGNIAIRPKSQVMKDLETDFDQNEGDNAAF